MLKIWGRRSSGNMQKVLWLAAELKLNYELIPAGGTHGGLKTPEFLAMNPHGLVPVMQDRETIIWESHAILRYLAASYGDNHFWSPDPKVRAGIDQWLDWCQTALQPDFIKGVFLPICRTPKEQQNWDAIREGIKRTNGYLQLLETLFDKKQYLAGNAFSLADIPAGMVLYRYYALDIERPKLPYVEAWYKRLQERPAFQEHVMVPVDQL